MDEPERRLVEGEGQQIGRLAARAVDERGVDERPIEDRRDARVGGPDRPARSREQPQPRGARRR